MHPLKYNTKQVKTGRHACFSVHKNISRTELKNLYVLKLVWRYLGTCAHIIYTGCLPLSFLLFLKYSGGKNIKTTFADNLCIQGHTK